MQRKIWIYSALLCLLAVGLGACKLNETPYSSIYTNTFYKTSQDAEAALTAAYASVADLYGGPSAVLIADFSADQVYPRPVVGRDTYPLYSYDPAYTTVVSYGRTNESPIDTWTNCYKGIENANWVITKVPATNMDTVRRAQIVAEALYLRAFFHWMLTKNFGNVVVRTQPSQSLADAYVAKSDAKDVYVRIYKDLDSAIMFLPDYTAGGVKGRPSKQVAQALYAKAALFNEDWATALQMAQQVINSNRYELMTDVRDVYDPAKEDAARQENMWAFEAESASPARSSQIMSLYGPANSDAPAYGSSSYGSAFAYQSFFDSFDPKDARRLLLDTFYINRQGAVVHQASITPITKHGVLVKKYMDPNSIGGSHSTNIPILRLADVYLIAAEAEARLHGATSTAYGYINLVRHRAHLDDLPAGLSADALIAAILQERSWELFAEADRWYDLTRTNTFLQVIPHAVNDVFPARAPQAKHQYFPIPQQEINANAKLVQNDPWK
ncbi:Starch-binding associating with outer membrane [Chitinophaga costaii]|uniref:Starch-binding associating with outer membrane n=1 Tax=Chitinophaga costaii TaxID=1335309 RepID=A0A1C4D3E5_9BACT|nr:RagB/SusD family nutrient uptake outer membrane protein [Chitinophaga costaii]PUZ24441.1 RagB/SusD family nutrient uptake outer membrane protein [Chitinophaga costaii]SCC25770.1 Starch-binding associating with outer membrane [Chitinophaga costaii]